MKNLSEKIAIVKGKKASNDAKKSFLSAGRTASDTKENNAFHMIGDDDL